MAASLVVELFDGPVDVVGDVHGEIEALNKLMGRLDYRPDGTHPGGRRLVFVGDLTDRGPDSPAVVDLVRRLVDRGLAQCVLGNHDLNILLGEEKHDNGWFFGKQFHHEGQLVPQMLLEDAGARAGVLGFFRRLPLALEGRGLRVVHACWQDEMIDVARQSGDALELYHRYARLIEQSNARRPGLSKLARELALQNRNPVKVLTSGRERGAAVPFLAAGKLREAERVPWWEEYEGPECCVFGHYASLPGEPHGREKVICIDYAVGKRHLERLTPGLNGKHRAMLAAFRFPEKRIVFDDGTEAHIGN